ncbi:DUF3592 domain-containing protein (plasmid) [Haloferax mediterranei ATCC 33500]|uniref:DUF3592 domain-containing protein n=1 Tax=Haloferax mediterranei (strain ATCC 33500 / DSM 1411 / JCM 8866 / NBRC 14739 / NCIMB 2177 / R-4) TaxID=523841 RepID=I3R960_HALMT|nr:DUF3592 domain-containing protein [Haloferax mediterranei]AFK20770.1 hypothetical protein HFX_4076 [Haloferax mediterranei ATCC 33500]AHZ23982.1 hypothetical protein BM92_19420 [Haloferax mediterranei ATCC 33500]ELZ97557.1 hypothetical protein C439_16613 [Haloferax mediterranei ATCC 33500]MDX5989654.1 DUF3592 domain-containing protein [Haloferax mediterranei ATCC 33500]QCQ77447.1 DUF3592 domain-containing protein [Haloferax mediterranei ATCC 33500]
MDTKGIGWVIILVLLGLVLGYYGFGSALAHNGAVLENEATSATVTGLDIETREEFEGSLTRTVLRSLGMEVEASEEKTMYRAVITYEYSVNGRTYKQTNLFPGSFSRWKYTKSGAERIRDEFEVGQSTTAYYNPETPSHAYIMEAEMPFLSALFGVLYVLVVMLTGAYYVREGFRRRNQRKLMNEMPIEQAQSLSTGPSQIDGVARAPYDDPDSAPFTDESCVLAKWEVEDSIRFREGPGRWNQVAEGYQLSPFYVDDGTGRTLVCPDKDTTFKLDDDNWQSVYVNAQNEAPEPVQSFLEYRPDVDPTEYRKRRYKQNLIRPGDDVYVFGTVKPRDNQHGSDPVDELVIERVADHDPRSEPMFLISARTQQDLVHSRRFALWRLPAGIMLIVGGIGLLLGMFGHTIGVSLPLVP